MTLDEVDSILSKELGLLFDAKELGFARTYFYERVCWHPSSNTRIARVAYDAAGEVTSIRLCVSSDNNNSVFVPAPMRTDDIKNALSAEIEAWRRFNRHSAARQALKKHIRNT